MSKPLATPLPEPCNPGRILQETIRDLLRLDPFLTEAELTILMQDQGDIVYEIDHAIGALGIVAAVAFERAEPQSNRCQLLTMNLIVTETPAVNRARQNAITALDAAYRARQILLGQIDIYGARLYDVGTLSHSISDDGIYQASLTFRALIAQN